MGIFNVGTAPEPLVNAGTGSVLIVNMDNTETLTLGFSPNITLGGPAVFQVPAQGSITLDVEDIPLYAYAPATIQVQTIPGGTQWDNPVGVQIALSALGLAKDTSVNAPAYGPPTHTDVTGVTSAVNSPSYGPPTHTDVITTGPAAITGGKKLSDVNTTLGSPSQDSSVKALAASGLTVAEDIASNGVGLLAFSQNVMNPGAITMTSGEITSYGPSTFSLVSYEIGVTLQGQSGDGSPYLAVSLEWSDATTGLIIRREIWQLGAASAAANQFSLTGPAKGTRLKVTLHWYGGLSTATDGVQIVVNQTSRIYTRDDGRTIEGYSGIIGFTNANFDLDAGLVANINPSIGADATVTRSMPLYHGAVLVQVNNPPQNCKVSIEAIASESINTLTSGTGLPFAQTVSSASYLNSVAYLPRSVCVLNVTNSGASTGTFNVNVWIAEQEL